MAVVNIPNDLLERTLTQCRRRQKRLGRRIAASVRKGRPAGTIDAERRKLQDLDALTSILENAPESRRVGDEP